MILSGTRQPRFLFVVGLVLACLAGMVVPTAPAWAKSVSLDWAAVGRASQYELQILRKNGKVAVQETIDRSQTSWKGELEPGFYSFRVRTIDRFARSGEWSEQTPLIVLPEAPEAEGAVEATKIEFYGAGGTAQLKWHAMDGAKGYHVIVRSASDPKKVEAERTVEETQAEFKDLPPGKYRWTVAAVVEPPKDFQDDEEKAAPLETRGSAPRELDLVRKPLEKPQVSSPIGPVTALHGRLRFKWKPVEGAESYLLTLVLENGKERTYSTKDHSLDLRFKGLGAFRWKVRALAPGNEGPVSEQSFTLLPESHSRGGYVALSSMVAPYRYNMVSPAQNYSVSTSASSASLRLSGEYQLAGRWLAGGVYDTVFINFAGVSVTRKSAEAFVKYALPLTRGENAWTLLPKVGVEGREYLVLSPTNILISQGGDAGQVQSVYSLGPQFGFDLRKDLTSRLSLGAKFSYFVPVTLTGAGTAGAKLGGSSSYRNASVGLQTLYWLDRRWAMAAGAYVDLRSLSYEQPGENMYERVSSDAVYFFGSVIFRFGD